MKFKDSHDSRRVRSLCIVIIDLNISGGIQSVFLRRMNSYEFKTPKSMLSLGENQQILIFLCSGCSGKHMFTAPWKL